MSDGPSTRDHRITKSVFPPCSTCRSRSQAPFCLYTLWLISDQPEGTFERLRYSLGGDRPSQTACQKLSVPLIQRMNVRIQIITEWYLTDDSTKTDVNASKSPTYTAQ